MKLLVLSINNTGVSTGWYSSPTRITKFIHQYRKVHARPFQHLVSNFDTLWCSLMQIDACFRQTYRFHMFWRVRSAPDILTLDLRESKPCAELDELMPCLGCKLWLSKIFASRMILGKLGYGRDKTKHCPLSIKIGSYTTTLLLRTYIFCTWWKITFLSSISRTVYSFQIFPLDANNQG